MIYHTSLGPAVLESQVSITVLHLAEYSSTPRPFLCESRDFWAEQEAVGFGVREYPEPSDTSLFGPRLGLCARTRAPKVPRGRP